MIQKGIDIKLNIRPIYLGLVHKYYYEGPCRFNPTEQCTPEFEEMWGAQMAQFFDMDMKAHLADVPSDCFYIIPFRMPCQEFTSTRH
ncbi:MAG: hypothetical protein LUG54_02860 [Clostridiales bacterium]|nr:hypothetical protein [Clostridiales bacterium]